MKFAITLFIILVVLGILISKGGISAAMGSLINRLSLAIAAAEGFFKKDSRPARNHNPGDLTKDLTYGRAVGKDKDGFIIYRTDADGWSALNEQVRLMLTGESQFYNPVMSIADVAQIYAPGIGAADWAQTVSGRLGVMPDTRLNELS